MIGEDQPEALEVSEMDACLSPEANVIADLRRQHLPRFLLMSAG
jgi:hypothetical protein